MHAMCLWRPEKGTESLGTGVRDDCELPHRCWELGSPGRAANAFNHPVTQPPVFMLLKTLHSAKEKKTHKEIFLRIVTVILFLKQVAVNPSMRMKSITIGLRTAPGLSIRNKSGARAAWHVLAL